MLVCSLIIILLYGLLICKTPYIFGLNKYAAQPRKVGCFPETNPPSLLITSRDFKEVLTQVKQFKRSEPGEGSA